MVFKVEPIIKALNSILKTNSKFKISNPKQMPNSKSKTKIILLSPAGEQFTAAHAKQWAEKYERLVFICGRYEGVDARLPQILKAKSCNLEAISIGPYVLSGGELPALVVMEAVARHIPGFLGKEESLEEARQGIGIPMYTRPEIFKYKLARGKEKVIKVPKVLLSGDHRKVLKWREKSQNSSNTCRP